MGKLTFRFNGATTSGNALATQKSWTFANPGDGIGVFGPRGVASTGTPANFITAMASSAAFACVKLLADDVAKLPFQILGNSKPLLNHPLYRLFRRPNAYQTAFTFWWMVSFNLSLRGNAYVYVERDHSGEAIALHPIPNERCTPLLNANGNLYYQFTTQMVNDGMTMNATSADMVHVKGVTLDGICGISPLALSNEAFAVALATQAHAGTLFKNGAAPSGMLTTAGKLSPEAAQRMATSWAEVHGGSANHHKVVVGEEGLVFTPISSTASDAQMIESRKFAVEEVCRVFRVPPHMVGHLEKASYSNVEQMSMDYSQNTILSLVRNIEESFEAKLLFEDEVGKIALKFDIGVFERADTATRFAAYSVARASGFMTANEVRAREGLPPMAGGDVLNNPAELGGAFNTPKPKPAASTEATDDDDQSDK